MIRTHIKLLLPLIVLTGCFPVDVYHQAGVTAQRQQSDLVNCQTKALRDAPTDIRTERTPLYYVPERRICRPTQGGQQHCKVHGGRWEGGEVYSYDANEQLRAKVLQQCMGSKGYAKVRLPQCERGQVAAGSVSARMPALTAQSCVAKGVGGQWVIIAP